MSIWDEIKAEQALIERFHGDLSIGGAALSPAERFVVLSEAVGRAAAQVLLGPSSTEGVRRTLVTLAACAVAWIEHIDKEAEQ